MTLSSSSSLSGVRRVASSSGSNSSNSNSDDGSATVVAFVILLVIIITLCVCMCVCQKQRRERAQRELAQQIDLYHHQQQQQQLPPQQQQLAQQLQGQQQGDVIPIVTVSATVASQQQQQGTIAGCSSGDDPDKRLSLWVLLAVSSVICMTSIIECVKERSHDKYYHLSFEDSNVQWALAVTFISCALSTITVICYLTCAHSLVRRRAIEAVMCTLAVVVWGIGLYKINDPQSGRFFGYFDMTPSLASWVCFALIVLLILNLGEDFAAGVVNHHVNSSTQKKARLWYLLAATSLVFIGSAIFMCKNKCSEYDNYPAQNYRRSICKRSKFAIFVGIIGLLLSGTMTVLVYTTKLTAWIEMCPTLVLLVIWGVGVRYIVPENRESPGSYSQTLYLSFWISFVLIVLLFCKVFKELVRGRPAQQQQQQQQPPSTLTMQESSDGNNGLDHMSTERPQQADLESSRVEVPKPSAVKTENTVKADANARGQGWAPEDAPVTTVSERIERQPNGRLVKVITEETLHPDGSKTVRVQRFLRKDQISSSTAR